MSAIHKFSLIYDADQDRLAWDTEDMDGGTTRLWLTQRLAKGLVSALIPLLQTATPQEVAPQHESTVQSWEQAAAMADFGTVPGVQHKSEPTAGLITTVQISQVGEEVVLTFEFPPEGSLTLGLAPASLRQTLTVMYRLYEAANWPLDIWPAWIAAPLAAIPHAVN